MALSRRRDSSLIWPGFVDAVTTLLMVLMFVLTIFTVMANAPEAWTAALCLIYVLAVMVVLGVVRFVLGRWSG